MRQFARRDTIDSINLFYDVMLCDRKIRTKEEKEEVEASYFAMCLLLPEKQFLKVINSFGGINECYMFFVEERLIRVRLKDLNSKIKDDDTIDETLKFDSKKDDNQRYTDSIDIKEEKKSSLFKKIFNKKGK